MRWLRIGLEGRSGRPRTPSQCCAGWPGSASVNLTAVSRKISSSEIPAAIVESENRLFRDLIERKVSAGRRFAIASPREREVGIRISWFLNFGIVLGSSRNTPATPVGSSAQFFICIWRRSLCFVLC